VCLDAAEQRLHYLGTAGFFDRLPGRQKPYPPCPKTPEGAILAS
jgi:hypothetical protein